MEARPKRRDSELLTQDSKDELLVYDLRTNKALCLNSTSATIWDLCDGKRTTSEIAAEIGSSFGAPVDESVVLLGLDQLSRNKLIDNSKELGDVLEGVPRREFVKRLGTASMVALPVILSIVAPSAVHAQSQTCLSDGTIFGCCPGDLTTCNPFCRTAATQVATHCCSEYAYAVFGDTEQCNSVCVCGVN